MTDNKSDFQSIQEAGDRSDAIEARKLGRLAEDFKLHWSIRTPLEFFWVMPQGTHAFICYVFFKTEIDLKNATRDGTVDQMQESLFAFFEKFGKGRREDIRVRFEFDSDENVKLHYQGNYFLRFR